jgi:hypothetical protein
MRTEQLENIFSRVEQKRITKLKAEEEEILRAAINKKVFHEALVQLITLRNLPHRMVEWAEFQALLATINYTVDEVLVTAHSTISKLIDHSFVIHEEILKEKLRNSLSKIHFTVDMWTSPNYKAF